MKTPKTVSAYIAAAPKEAQTMLREIRAAIRNAAPQATERISYRMPYYAYKGRLAYFAAFKDHVSFFVMPSPTVYAPFAKQIKKYKTGKATLQFPIGTKVPTVLIKKIVKVRVKQNETRKQKKGYERFAAVM